MAQFTNQAQLSYQAAQLNSNLAVGEIQSTLRMTKTALQTSYQVGDTLIYAVTVSNAGENTSANLTLTDDLGAYTATAGTLYPLTYQAGSLQVFLNGVAQTAPTPTAVQPLTIRLPQIPAGGTLTLVYRAVVTQYAPLGIGAQIRNTAFLRDACRELRTAFATVGAAVGPSLVIAKSIVPVPVLENGTLTYTFVVLNTGNTAATVEDQTVIRDLFAPILNDITVTLNGTELTSPSQYTYDEATGRFATVPGLITVPGATYVQDEITGVWTMTPGSVTLLVSGTI